MEEKEIEKEIVTDYKSLFRQMGGKIMEHITAKVSCFARAYHHRNNRTHIFDDTDAKKLLGADYDKIANSMAEGLDFFFPEFKGTKEEGLRKIVDKQLSPSVLARSAFCESKLVDEIADGCKQYVIFASGYDTFSLRNTNTSLKIYELDYPELLKDKLEHIRQAQLVSDAVYISCNLAKDNWEEKLFHVGYMKNQKAFGSLLGISYYLSKAEFEKLLADICDIMTKGSAICFDYPSADESVETKTNQMLALGAGEKMKAVYTRKDIMLLLQKCGLRLKEYFNSKEMTETYFSKYNNANPKYQMQAPDGVCYVYAIKE